MTVRASKEHIEEEPSTSAYASEPESERLQRVTEDNKRGVEFVWAMFALDNVVALTDTQSHYT